MDTDPRLSEESTDRALRSLFKENGHLRAPDGLEALVMQRLAAQPKPLQQAPALIPKRAWYGLLSALVIAVVCALLGPANGEADPFLPTSMMNWVNSTVLRSQWVIMGTVCLSALMLTHTILERFVRLDQKQLG